MNTPLLSAFRRLAPCLLVMLALALLTGPARADDAPEESPRPPLPPTPEAPHDLQENDSPVRDGAPGDEDTDLGLDTLPPLRITASRLGGPVTTPGPTGGTRSLESAAPVTRLGNDDLRRLDTSSLGGALRHEPGVTSSEFGPGAGRPILRGVGGERVRVQDGALGVADASATSEDHAVADHPLGIRSLEIYRGPATIRQGPGAIGGIVRVDDGRIPTRWIRRPLTATIDYRRGSADNEESFFARFEGQFGQLNWHLSTFSRASDDIEIPGEAESDRLRALEGEEEHEEEDAEGDKLANSNATSRGVKAGVSWITREGRIGASVSWFSTEYGIPGGHEHEDDDHDDDHDDDDHADAASEHAVRHNGLYGRGTDDEGVDIVMERVRFDVSGRRCVRHRLLRYVDVDFGYTRYAHEEREDGQAGTRFESDAVEGRVGLVLRKIQGWKTTVGVQGEFIDFRAEGAEAFVPPSETIRVGGFVSGRRWLTGYTTLELAGRLDMSNVDTAAASRTFYAASASAAIDYRLRKDTYLGLTASYAERAPTATELFADGVHVATQAYEIGDIDLDKERALGLNASIRHDSRLFSARLDGYYTWYPTYIDLAPTGGMQQGQPEFAFIEKEAEFLGAEADITWHAWCRRKSKLDVRLFGDVTRARDLDTKDPLPRVPPVRFGAQVLAQWGCIAGDVELVHATKQDRVAPDEIPTDAYTLLSAGLAYTARWSTTKWTAYIRGTNLLDEEARIHSSRLKDIAPLRGRSFLVGLRVDY